MGIIDARIGGKLIAGQFATLPGTVKWMLQNRSLTNQIIQGTQGFFGSHKVQCFGGSLPERKSKNFWRVFALSDPVPLGMHHHEKGSQHAGGDDVAEMKSATASAKEREDDKERKNDEVEARNRPEHTPARKEAN